MKPCDIKELRGVIKGLVGNAGDGVSAGGSTLHRDALGSVRAVTTAAGLKAERATYRPYGEQTEASFDLATAPETKGFIGERHDADAGLHYLNARYYDPKLAMFVQPDWWEVTKAGVGTNRYRYSLGDPVNASDPGGHDLKSQREANQRYNRENGIGKYDPSSSGISTDAWKQYYRGKNSEAGGLNGKINPDPSCYHCYNTKEMFPSFIKMVDAKTGTPLFSLYARSGSSLAKLYAGAAIFFNSEAGQGTLDRIRQVGRTLEIFEMLPFDRRSADNFKFGMSMASSFQIFGNTDLSSAKYKDTRNGQHPITIDHLFAHEVGHGVYGVGMGKANENKVIADHDNPYLSEMGRVLRGEY